MRGRGNKDNTISHHFRNIRRAWNLVKNQKLVDADLYPFGPGKYELGKQVKEQADKPNPLTLEQLEKWKNLRLEGIQEKVRKLCLLSYYLNGSNFTDLIQLKDSEHRRNGRISFNRSKTQCLITIKETQEISVLLKAFENDSMYLLDILNNTHTTGQQIKDRSDKYKKKVNKAIRQIAPMVGKNPLGFTFYNFRDTTANVLLRKGVDIKRIQQVLGHKDINTTIRYIESFGVEEMDEVTGLL